MSTLLFSSSVLYLDYESSIMCIMHYCWVIPYISFHTAKSFMYFEKVLCLLIRQNQTFYILHVHFKVGQQPFKWHIFLTINIIVSFFLFNFKVRKVLIVTKCIELHFLNQQHYYFLVAMNTKTATYCNTVWLCRPILEINP